MTTHFIDLVRIYSDFACVCWFTSRVYVALVLFLSLFRLPSSVFFVFFLMIRRPPRSTLDRSSAASDVYKRQLPDGRGSGRLTSLDASRQRTAHGVGFACCFKNVGFSLGAPESCPAWVELHGRDTIERAVVGCTGAEVGQGAHSLFRQIAAEVLGLDSACVEVRGESTEVAGSSGSAAASRMSFMAGSAPPQVPL